MLVKYQVDGEDFEEDIPLSKESSLPNQVMIKHCIKHRPKVKWPATLKVGGKTYIGKASGLFPGFFLELKED
jgi:hypothetical protein